MDRFHLPGDPYVGPGLGPGGWLDAEEPEAPAAPEDHIDDSDPEEEPMEESEPEEEPVDDSEPEEEVIGAGDPAEDLEPGFGVAESDDDDDDDDSDHDSDTDMDDPEVVNPPFPVRDIHVPRQAHYLRPPFPGMRPVPVDMPALFHRRQEIETPMRPHGPRWPLDWQFHLRDWSREDGIPSVFEVGEGSAPPPPGLRRLTPSESVLATLTARAYRQGVRMLDVQADQNLNEEAIDLTRTELASTQARLTRAERELAESRAEHRADQQRIAALERRLDDLSRRMEPPAGPSRRD